MKTVVSLLIAMMCLINFCFAQEEGHLSETTRKYLKHDPKIAEKLFEAKCTRCHSKEKALSRRTFQDWKLGITLRHKQPKNWLSDQEAKIIFLHMVVHLEPEITEIAFQKSISKPNWRFILIYLSGGLAFTFLGLTFLVGKFKTLRRRFFKRHRTLAHIGIFFAVFHISYILYLLLRSSY